MISYKAFYGNKPNLSHLKIINSALYSHNVEHESDLKKNNENSNLKPGNFDLLVIEKALINIRHKILRPIELKTSHSFERMNRIFKLIKKKLNQLRFDELKINNSDYDELNDESNSENSISEY
jgi:hypothetical protein